MKSFYALLILAFATNVTATNSAGFSTTSSNASLTNIAADDRSKTCTDESGRPASDGVIWCRAGERHVCNGRNGEWVNTRKKCTN